MWQLVRQHAKKYTLGIHPSWQSGDTFSLLKKKRAMEEIVKKKDSSFKATLYLRLIYLKIIKD